MKLNSGEDEFQKMGPLVKKFNRALAKLKTTDEFQTILNKYRLNPSISVIPKVGMNRVYNLNSHNPTPHI